MINPQIAHHPLSWNQERAFAVVKSASTITLFTAGVLGAAALAYYNPYTWLNAAAAVTCINLYTTTKALRYGNSQMIRAVLSINLAALGILSLGGASTALYHLARQISLSITASASNSLYSSFFLTGLAGYAVPACLQILNKSYSLINDPYWKTRCEQLQRHFNAAPEVGLGLLQTGLFSNARLLAATVAPQVITPFSSDCPAIEMLAAATTPPGVKELNSTIDAIEALQFNDPLFLQKERNLYVQLQNSLDPIPLEEAESAGTILLDKSRFFLEARQFSKQEFINLFHGPLLRKLNHNIDDFLDGMAAFPSLQNRFATLALTLNQIQAEFDRGPTDALKERLEQLNAECLELRNETEKLYKEKNRWNHFFQAWGEENPALLQRFSQVERLKRLIANPVIENQLNLFHQTLYALNLPQNQAFPLRQEEQASYRTRIYRLLGQAPQIQANVISQKINQAIYRLCTMGLILVPVCIYPYQAAFGFGAGSVYFILKRFNWALSTETEGELLRGIGGHTEIGVAIDVVTGRNFFSLTEQARDRMETFTQADLFGRMRLLNFEIFTTFWLTLPIHRIEMGGIFQGLALAKEVSDLI